MEITEAEPDHDFKASIEGITGLKRVRVKAKRGRRPKGEGPPPAVKQKIYNPITCVACGHEFTRGKFELEKHLKKMGPFHDGRCGQCGEKFEVWADHKKHVENKHDGEWKFRCGFCDEVFLGKYSYAAHTKSIKEPCPKKVEYFNQERHFCSMCGHSCRTKGGLMFHVKNFHEKSEEELPCPFCGLKFPNSQKLTQHKRNHHDPCSCDLCGKHFKARSLLKKHIIVNHTRLEDKPHRCTVCPKGFSDARTLSDHMNIHTGARPYKCPFCEKAYPDGSTLNQHKNAVHLGKKRTPK